MNPFAFNKFLKGKSFPAPYSSGNLSTFKIEYEPQTTGMRTTQTFESDLLVRKQTPTQKILENSERYTDTEFKVAVSRYQFQNSRSSRDLISNVIPKSRNSAQMFQKQAQNEWNGRQSFNLPAIKKPTFGKGKTLPNWALLSE